MTGPLPAELTPDQLRAVCDPTRFAFETTAEVNPTPGIVGQPRATSALQFGLGMADGGYHIYVAGSPGTGKMTAVRAFLANAARARSAPPDVVYVFNFQESERPRALLLPAGRGRQLARDVEDLLHVARRQLPQAFESDEYTNRRAAISKTLEDERENRLSVVNDHARAAGFALQVTQMGLALIPLVGGKPMAEGDFEALSPGQRQLLQERRAQLEAEIAQVLKLLRDRERGVREDVERLDRDVALHGVGGLVDDLNDHYDNLPSVVEYLGQLQEDMVAHLDLFRTPAGEAGPEAAGLIVQREQALRRYRVNVVVSQAPGGAPVVVEANPTYQNLVGRVEKEAQFGALTTDFTLIRGGALHRANGGYLVLRAEDVLRQPLAWEGLKRALRNRVITIEDPSDVLGMAAVRTIRPEPIPLDVKVVLVGELQTYFLLYSADQDFPELFRVRADFDGRMPRTTENEDAFVAFVGRICQEESLRHVDREALGLLIEHASRLAEDQQQLSAQFGTIADVVREANYWAGFRGAATVGAAHVREAIDQKIYRSGLVAERLREAIAREILFVDVSGSAVGQVNGLAVQSIADYSFGHPSRITASVGIGREGLVDVEREVKLGGAFHSKGVMILAGFLTERFATNRPLALSARLAFEQSYGEVDGDSASSAELYALLSALSGVPIKQSFAVTGSVNQKGQIQAIGGVNEKIEGFFAVCKEKGLSGEQGVLIPAANVTHLMLRDEVLEAVRAGQFHVYRVSTVDQGITLLTGVPSGERDETGRFPADTINGRIEARLEAMGRAMREAGDRGTGRE